MRKNGFYLALATIFIMSCSRLKTADEGYYFQDFDNLQMWARGQYNLTTEKAHSGIYSARTGDEFEYSQTFEMDFAVARNAGYKALQVSAWVYEANADAKAGLIASIESAKATSAYISADFKDFITGPEQWEKCNLFLKFPKDVPDDAKIRVYLWSPDKSKVFIDDVMVKLNK